MDLIAANIREKADLIWAIADKLTGVYKPHEYGEVILPLTFLRRLDCVLDDTRDAVRAVYEHEKGKPDAIRDILLRQASGHDFYNTSKYNFERLGTDSDNIKSNFDNYLKGFSQNVQDIIMKFKFRQHVETMAEKGILYIVVKEFSTPKADFHPSKVSNLEMGYVFEEIIRRFSESHNEDAGQHYTPREVIRLMVNILFCNDRDLLTGDNIVKTVYENEISKVFRNEDFGIYEVVTGKTQVPPTTGIKPTVLEQIKTLARRHGIRRVILFGSRARGDFQEKSDIDLAVSGGDAHRFRLAVEEETDTLLRFDVVNLDTKIDQKLLDNIHREGVTLYEEV